ncbi:MAG: hypothetical protein ACR2NT_15815 [Acidimicrobiia bacterium]
MSVGGTISTMMAGILPASFFGKGGRIRGQRSRKAIAGRHPADLARRPCLARAGRLGLAIRTDRVPEAARSAAKTDRGGFLVAEWATAVQ